MVVEALRGHFSGTQEARQETEARCARVRLLRGAVLLLSVAEEPLTTRPKSDALGRSQRNRSRDALRIVRK